MKHYVIFLDWASNDEYGFDILGVAHSIEEAKEIFNGRLQSEIEFAEDNGYEVLENTEMIFEAAIMGFYNAEHTILCIKEV